MWASVSTSCKAFNDVARPKNPWHSPDVTACYQCCPRAGIIGAGTNNARLAGLLRGLASYYYKEPTLLFLVRAAQGLVHAGKGLLNLAPTHTDGHLVSGEGLY